MDAADLGGAFRAEARDARHCGDGVADRIAGARERRRRHGRRAVARMERRDASRRFLRGIHEIGAVAAVHVHVDEAGDDDTGDARGDDVWLRSFTHGDDLFVVDGDGDRVADLAADERAAEKRQRHAQIVPRMVGRPPVAPGTLVSSPAIESLAMSAMAIASFSCR